MIELLGIFYQSRYWEDHVIRGPNNGGPTVPKKYFLNTRSLSEIYSIDEKS